MTAPIAILGAGPSGLVLARLLELNNIDYVVFERDANDQAVFTGGTLDIHKDDGQVVLREAGLLDEFEKLARYDGQAFKAIDNQGNTIWDKKFNGQKDRPEIDRTQLRRILLDSVPSRKIRWDARVEAVEKCQDGLMKIRFTNGTEEAGFKLVVGADGAWSKARPLVTAATPVYSSYCYFQTTITTSNDKYEHFKSFAGAGSYMALAGGTAIMAQQVSNGSYNIYVGLKVPRDWSKTNADLFHSPQFRQDLLDTYFADWAEEPRSLIRDSDGDWHSWNLFTLPKDCLPYKTVPGVTLVGDAAHLSIPNGEGVNCAMFDSYELAQEIVASGVDKLDEAVDRYEQKMVPRGSASIEKGEQCLDMFFAPDAPRAVTAWVAEMNVMIAEMEAKRQNNGDN